MTTASQKISIAMALFLLLAFALSFWISPPRDNPQSFLPYLADAFQQCMTQKTDGLVRYLSKTGGYAVPLPGIAHEITFEKAVEAGIAAILPQCETLLQQEEVFTRELHTLHVSVDDGVSVFFDGLWKSATGKTVPGFVLHIPLPIRETFARGHEVLQTIKETEIVRQIVLSALDEEDPRQAISHGVKQFTVPSVAFAVSLDDISLDRKKREISFPLMATVMQGDYTLSFMYPIFFNSLDLQEGCKREVRRGSLSEGEEITFDCGWFRCIRPWKPEVSFPCKKPFIFIDNQLASGYAG